MGDKVFDQAMRIASQKGWLQGDLARHLGVSEQNVSNWKRRGVPSDQYVNIADVLNCSLDELLGRTQFIGKKSDAAPWPYSDIDETKFRHIPLAKAKQLEGAILLAAAQLGLDVKKDG